MNGFFDLAGRVDLVHKDKDGNILNTRRINNLVTQSGRALAGILHTPLILVRDPCPLD